MPFAGYTDHADCVSKNRDKGDPDAYCATIERKVHEGKKALEVPDEHTGGAGEIYVHTSLAPNLWYGDHVSLIDPKGMAIDGLVSGFHRTGIRVQPLT